MKFCQRDVTDNVNSFRIFEISPEKSIDFMNMIEFETKNPNNKRAIKRNEK